MSLYVSAQVPEPIDRYGQSKGLFSGLPQDYNSSPETEVESDFDHKSTYNFGLNLGLCGQTDRNSLGFHHTVNLDDDDEGWAAPGDDHINLLPANIPTKEIPVLLRISNLFSSFLNISRCK